MEIPNALLVELNRMKRQVDIANAALNEAQEIYLHFMNSVNEILKAGQKQDDEKKKNLVK